MHAYSNFSGEGHVSEEKSVSRRTFVGGVAAAAGVLGFMPGANLFAMPLAMRDTGLNRERAALDELSDYDGYAKISFNENPYGPPESVLKAMTKAFKYSNRYGYPDGGIVEEIAKAHGVKPENILLTAGSGEVLDVVGTTFTRDGMKKVLGSEPSYSQVYEHVVGVKSEAVKLPLTADYRQDIPALIKAAHDHAKDLGFVYLCNPNNPTGRIVTKAEIKQLLDGLPPAMPVLIDEAYHHFVNNADYATSIPYVLEGRPVIVARTFSKIAALAGMRLGFAIASKEFVNKMRPWSMGSISAVVKWGGVAALADTDSQARVKKVTIDLREQTMAQLNKWGYETIKSDTNFFMVSLKKPVVPVIEAFKKKGVLVGRPFPPMNTHLRVSIGTPDEMARFQAAWKEIMGTASAGSGNGK